MTRIQEFWLRDPFTLATWKTKVGRWYWQV